MSFQITYNPDSYDAIVIGTGVSGGWAAKELSEKGLKTLVIDRGREVKHPDYPTAILESWELPHNDKLTLNERLENPVLSRIGTLKPSNKLWYMEDREQEYEEKNPFLWVRGNQVGGRSIMWGRQVYRWNDFDFAANLKDGIAVDWPIRYKDLDPWYDYVEKYIGVSGSKSRLKQVPDGIFLPTMEMNCAEKYLSENITKTREDVEVMIGRVANLTKDHNGREACKFRDRCNRGCPFGAYFCSLSSTLPAAERTKNMTLISDTIVTEILYDDNKEKAKGVRVLDKKSGELREYYSKIVFLNASTISSASILLNSKSSRFPNGMGNDSGELGHNIMDHYIGGGASVKTDLFSDQIPSGKRPNGIYIPRFQNIASDTKQRNYTRGFQFQGSGSRESWWRIIPESTYGLDLKEELSNPGKWQIGIMGLGEMLPNHDNHIKLHDTEVDKYGLPKIVFDVKWGENELKMGKDMVKEAMQILTDGGFTNVKPVSSNAIPASAVHEMGSARMGHDPRTSVLNKWNQIHSVKNVFVTDGSCMTSSACQNPSLTYMALTARAVDYAVESLKKGEL